MRPFYLYMLVAGLLVCGAVLLNDSAAQPAATDAGARVAVCDVVRVFNNYIRGTDLTKMMNQERAKVDAENRKRSDAIDAIKEELGPNGLKKGSPEYDKRYLEMQRLSIDREAYVQYKSAVAAHQHFRLTKEMFQEILAMVEKVAKEKKFRIVLLKNDDEFLAQNTRDLLREIGRQQVLYCDDSVDISEAVLTRMNRAYTAPN